MKNALYMLCCTNNRQMNSFILRTEDGKTVVIDGGYREEADKLLSKLREVTGEEVPHIDAWFLSHAHCDHIDAFMELISHHADRFTVDGVYYCFPSYQFFAKYEAREAHTVREFYEILPLFADRAHILTQGDRYEIGSAVIDILATFDPARTGNAINNSTSVFRLTLGGKTVMFLGDAGVEEGADLLARYGSDLKSDLCQMAHHGQNGVEKDVYEAIAPEGAIWCTPDWLWDNNIGQGFNTHIWKTVTVRGWMEGIGVRVHYIAKDGDHCIPLGD